MIIFTLIILTSSEIIYVALFGPETLFSQVHVYLSYVHEVIFPVFSSSSLLTCLRCRGLSSYLMQPPHAVWVPSTDRGEPGWRSCPGSSVDAGPQPGFGASPVNKYPFDLGGIQGWPGSHMPTFSYESSLSLNGFRGEGSGLHPNEGGCHWVLHWLAKVCWLASLLFNLWACFCVSDFYTSLITGVHKLERLVVIVLQRAKIILVFSTWSPPLPCYCGRVLRPCPGHHHVPTADTRSSQHLPIVCSVVA